MNTSQTGCSGNITTSPVFHIAGFQISSELMPLLFLLLITIYLLTVAGNLLILLTVSTHERLHSPMYLFLSSLSVLEICYTTTIVPTMLESLLMKGSTLSFASCLTQLHVFAWLIVTECFHLTVMAYDRYVAICYSLHYTTLMNVNICLKLLTWIWLISCIPTSVTSILLSVLSFPPLNEMDHFFGDILPLLEMACSDTSLLKIAMFTITSSINPISFLLIIVSYIYIISAILRMPSVIGRHRAFSTCSSHLAVVLIYFGSLITMYLVPASGQSLHVNKAFSLLYTVMTPLFNPLIYTLRNKDIRETMGNVLSVNICIKQT